MDFSPDSLPPVFITPPVGGLITIINLTACSFLQVLINFYHLKFQMANISFIKILRFLG